MRIQPDTHFLWNCVGRSELTILCSHFHWCMILVANCLARQLENHKIMWFHNLKHNFNIKGIHSISIQIRSLAWDSGREVWASTLSSIHITLHMFANVLNMHQTSSSLVIGHAVYSTCPLISCIGQRYHIEVIVEETSTSCVVTGENCVSSWIAGDLNIDINEHTNWGWTHFFSL